MKSRKVVSAWSVGIVAVACAALMGWLTSTRHVDLCIRENGVQCANASIILQGGGHASSIEYLTTDENGCVRLPSDVARNWIAFQIRDGGRVIADRLTMFDLGETIVDYRGSETILDHSYRFLWFSTHEHSKEIDLIRKRGEQGAGGKPVGATQPPR